MIDETSTGKDISPANNTGQFNVNRDTAMNLEKKDTRERSRSRSP